MTFRLLDAAAPGDLAEWTALWRRSPPREAMAHPAWARLFARPGDRAVAAVGEDGGAAILFPLLLRPLAAEPWAAGDPRWDATTPYGYGGPFAWGAGRDDAAFWRAFEGWCRDAGVVTTFARLSLFEDELAALPVVPEARLENVAVPLDGGPDALWRGYDSQVRRWVRAAEAAGVVADVDRDGAGLDAFVAVYTETMRRRGADDWYFFPRAFFEALVRDLAGHVAFVHARLAGEVVSSDLLLLSRRRAYYTLGGTLEQAFHAGPNYLVKHRAATWAAAEGRTHLVLGGGREPGDTLFRYKRAWARHGVRPFRVACLVHDAPAVRELVSRRAAHEAGAGREWSPRPGFFPAYRA
jgi:hypothetical protein